MANEDRNIQNDCSKCQESLDVGESLFVPEVVKSETTILDFLQHGLPPPNRFDAMKIQRKSSRSFIKIIYYSEDDSTKNLPY